MDPRALPYDRRIGRGRPSSRGYGWAQSLLHDVRRTGMPFPAFVIPLLLLVAVLSGASRCGPAPGARDEAPLPPLVDARGVFDPGAFEALIDRIEDRRGLRFIRRPTLVLAAADDPQLATPGAAAIDSPCVQEREAARLVCRTPPDAVALALALAELIDAQHHPALVERAPELAGDPGEAIRLLLSARTKATLGTGLGPPLDEPPPAPTEQDTLEIAEGADLDGFLAFVASTFLRAQRDPEAPFRRPPLSTRQLLSPRDYSAGVNPVLLVGAAPDLGGCEVVGDASVGPAALLRAVAHVGGEVRVAFLVAWRGDRAVRFSCASGQRPWVYVVDFDDPRAAEAFAGQIDLVLPGSLRRPFAHLASGRSVLAWHGLERKRVLAWEEGLERVELRSLEQLE